MYTDRAALYDAIYHWKDYAGEAAQVRALLHDAGLADGARLLEVACGTGAYLAPLSAWFDVAGCDLNEGMLAVARAKLPTTALWSVDMCELVVPEPYDAVVCLFSSVGYLLDEARLRRACVAMAAAVRTGGTVIVEPWIPAEAYAVGRPSMQTYTSPDLHLARACVAERRGDVAVMPMHWLVVPRDGPVERFVDVHELWFCPPETMRAALHDAGLDVTFNPSGLGNGRGLWVGRLR